MQVLSVLLIISKCYCGPSPIPSYPGRKAVEIFPVGDWTSVHPQWTRCVSNS